MLTDEQYRRLIASMDATTTGDILASLDRALTPAKCAGCAVPAPIADVGSPCPNCGDPIEQVAP